mgnify:CR=1 FL=1
MYLQLTRKKNTKIRPQRMAKTKSMNINKDDEDGEDNRRSIIRGREELSYEEYLNIGIEKSR